MAFRNYPKARISQGPGELFDATDITVTYADGEKAVSTLRKNNAGSTSGARTSSISYSSAISEEGFERDYMQNYHKRKVLQYRIKLPGGTILTHEGRLSNPVINSTVDGEVKFTVTVVTKDQADPN